MKTEVTQTESQPGIGYCDDCGEERWPQVYIGYGMMVCLDCLSPREREVFCQPAQPLGG